MMNLVVVYRFQKQFFVAGNISCPTIKAKDKISLQIKKAETKDKLFIKDKIEADKFLKNFRMKDFYPIKKYFDIEGYEIGEKEIDEIKGALGGAEAIWVNFPESHILR